MRVYFRASPRTGVSMPWWLAILVGIMWFCVMVAVAAAMLCFLVLVGAFQLGQRGWRAWRERSATGPVPS